MQSGESSCEASVPWKPPSLTLKESSAYVRSREHRKASRSRSGSGRRRRRREGEHRSRSRRSRDRRSRRDNGDVRSIDQSKPQVPGISTQASASQNQEALLGMLTQAVSRAVGVTPPAASYQVSPASHSHGPPGYGHPGHGQPGFGTPPPAYGHAPLYPGYPGHPPAHLPCHGHAGHLPHLPPQYPPLQPMQPMHYYPPQHMPQVHYTYAPHPHYPGYFVPVPAMPPVRAREPDSDEDRKREKKEPPPPAKFDDDHWEEPRSQTRLKLFREECSDEFRQLWKYPLSDESRRSFAGYIPKVLNEEVGRSFFTKIKDSCEWKQPEGAFGQIPRKTCWMVKGSCKCKYRYGGLEVEPEEFPQWMIELMEIVLKPCGIAQNEWPNSCNLNLYEDGGMTVGWHSDDERLFQGKFRDCRIISLSLGATRKFELRRNWPEDREEHVQRVVLNSGDLLTMEGMFQKHFQHRVPREDVKEPRINLTWRWVKKHIPDCPVGRARRV